MTVPVWLALAAIVAMIAVAALRRFPIWNPLYFFGILFALQIGVGFVFVRELGMDASPGFTVPLLGAYLLTLGLFLLYSMRDHEVVARNPDLEEQFELTRLTPSVVRTLAVLLIAIAAHNTVVNLILIIRWETLPVIAYNLHRRGVALSTPGVVLPQDVARPFSVPFFSVVADHLVNPAVVIYLALVFCPTSAAPADRGTGFRSISPWIHVVFGLVMANAAIVHRRNPLLVGIATAVLVLYLLRKVSRKTLVAGGIVLLVGAIAFGQWRRGKKQLPAAVELGLPPVAGNTVVYEPLVYVGSGVPNFHRYWAADHPPAGGEFLLSSLFPRPVDRALGLDVNRTEMLRQMFGEGYAIPGQTLRTPWFEAFYDFGWVGVYVLAVLFPTGVHWLYRRTLVGARRRTPSLAFFTLAKVIFLFPFINVLFQLPFWTTAGMAVLIDWRLAASSPPTPDGRSSPAVAP